MTPKIINDRPPNFEQILRVFPMAINKGVIFAYDGAIYNPSAQEIPPSLIAHETVHLERQAALEGGADQWWGLYLLDEAFRYNEELLAHRAEYQHIAQNAPSRQQRRVALKEIAKRLASPLYGRMTSRKQAEEDIKND